MARRGAKFVLLAAGVAATLQLAPPFVLVRGPTAQFRSSRVRRAAIEPQALEVAQASLPGISVVVVGAAASSLAQLNRGANAEKAEPGSFFGPQRWVGRTAAIALTWAVFLGYAFFLAPGKGPESQAADQALLNQVLSTPFDGTVSPLFICIFNMLGIWPVIYSATLLPAAERQSPVPAYPLVLASFFLGAFALSPYLAVREYRGTAGESGTPDWFTANLLENRLTGLLLLAAAVYLSLFALGNGVIGAVSPAAAWASFIPVFTSSLTAHVSSVDFMVLWMFFGPVLLEDGRRRGIFLGKPDEWDTSEKARFALCAAVPVFGGLAWLLSRPELPKQR